jgi:ABC-type transporter Mla subunit MlaD
MVNPALASTSPASIDVLSMSMTPSTFWILLIVSIIIIGGFIAFVTLLTTAGIRARDRLRGLNDVVKVMEGGDHVSQRQKALSTAQGFTTKRIKNDVGTLWGDFDSSLVDSADGKELHSTEPAEEYFNSETIAPELLHGRLLPFLPNGMTAVGVLGTFIGLTVGLSGLDLGAGSDSTELRAGVSDLISGAALAFATSMLGVFFSVIANLSHNIVARRITREVRDLQERSDRDLQRQAADYSLVKIAQSNVEQNDALQALDEKLGVQFQKAVEGMSADMSKAVAEALQMAIGPAMAELSSAASNQSSHVMENLIGKFSSSFEELGRQQASKLEGASTQLESTLAGMSSKLDAVLTQVNESISSTLEGTAGHTQRMTDQVHALTEAMALQQAKTEAIVQQLTELLTTAGRSMTSSTEHLRSSTAALQGAADTFTSSSTELVQHLESTGTVLTASRSQLEAAGQAMQDSAAEFAKTHQGMAELRGHLDVTTAGLEKSAQTAQTAFGDLTKHHNAFLTSLEQQVTGISSAMTGQIEEIQKQMSTWLEEYAQVVSQQTTQRMSEWNQHTERYSTTMVEVVDGLHDVVQEIQDRNGQKIGS